MQKKGLPLSTIALVVIMLGALFMVSKQVTPPPAMPAPEPVTPAVSKETPKPPTPEEEKKTKEQQEKMREFYKKKMAEEKAAKERELKVKAALEKAEAKSGGETAEQKAKRYDPNSTNIDSKYFGDMPMGAEGIEETDKAVALAAAAKEKIKQEGSNSAKPKLKMPGMERVKPTGGE